MKIVIRTDASTEWGTGHVMRCLTLAEELCMQGADVFFMCRRRPGDLIDFIQESGFTVDVITGAEPISWQEDAVRSMNILENIGTIDWLIVDHYGLDARWEGAIKPYVNRLMVIDDLADRPHDCHLLLDQNLYRDMEKRYEGLIPKTAETLLGPAYTLLREEFTRTAHASKERDGKVERLLVSFGGSDPTNETLKTLKAIRMLSNIPLVDVVIGNSNPYQQEIVDFCKGMEKACVHIQTKQIACLMKRADVAIGAGGSSVWERCYMELPSMIIETASNQTEIISFLQEREAICYLGKSEEVDSEQIYRQLVLLRQDSSVVRKMCASVREIMKGHERYGVSKYIMGGDRHD